jgi:hypothetical protein
MDPVLRHWVTCAGGAFGAAGFLFQERVADAVADTLNAILHFELNDTPRTPTSPIVGVVFLIIVLAAIWFTAPSI